MFVYQQKPDDNSLPATEPQLVSNINEAIKSNSLTLYRQDILCLEADAQDSEQYEILIRMTVEGRVIPPGAFMPAAERQHILPTLDCWVIDSYFDWLTNLPNDCQRLNLAHINLSGQSLADNDFVTFLKRALERYPIDPAKICFEITETDAVANLRNTLSLMENLKPLGVSFALDNFGSGFSSYGYLKTLPVDYVKIDGGYIRELLDGSVNYAIVKSIIEIANSLNIATIAESVETEAVYTALKELGVKFLQGYSVDAPEPLADFQSKPQDLKQFSNHAGV